LDHQPRRSARAPRQARRSLWATSLATVLALAAVAAGCSGDDDDLATVTSAASSTSTTGGSTTSTTRAATTTVTATPQQRAPLTGLPYGFLENPARPALAVKIDGAPEAQPQVGLDVADVVYEEPVEGLIRYIAIFHSKNPGEVGPIRSVRPMDPDLIEPLHGLFAISGGIGTFVQSAQEVARVFQEGNPGYYRAGDRRAPHNLLGRAVDLWNQADGETTPAPLWDFDTTTPTTSAVCGIDVTYFSSSRIHYDLDVPSGTWKRSINGEPQLAYPDKQIAPNNIVIQLVDTRPTTFVDVTGTKVVETIVVGGGDAYVMTGGTGHLAHWDRPDASQPAKYIDNGTNQPIKFQPGTTWVALVPKNATQPPNLQACPTGTPGPTTTTTATTTSAPTGSSTSGTGTTRAGSTSTTAGATTTTKRS
jgi:hypothetical protein